MEIDEIFIAEPETAEATLSEQFKSEIKKRGLKLIFVSEQIGINNPYLSLMLNNNKPISAPVRIKLNNFLGTNF